MRYFKWGVARLILEPDVCPDIVPIYVDGTEEIMHESREWPRWIPRVGKSVQIWFGDNVGGKGEGSFRDLRQKWASLVERDRKNRPCGIGLEEKGRLSEFLKYGKEAEELRKECAKRIRNEVLKIRRQRGLPDEDPKEGLVETWIEEGGLGEGKMKDGSWIKDV
jgi:monolysocardiolipin acyltransferase